MSKVLNGLSQILLELGWDSCNRSPTWTLLNGICLCIEFFLKIWTRISFFFLSFLPSHSWNNTCLFYIWSILSISEIGISIVPYLMNNHIFIRTETRMCARFRSWGHDRDCDIFIPIRYEDRDKYYSIIP